MTDDDGGVLGNLPRSRPGHRSEKRTAAQAAPAGGAAKRPKSATRAAGATKPPTSAPRKAAHGSESRDAQPAAHPGDPVGGAIRTVTGVAATGARVAGGVAREVLRRLPRP
jgi:hypothetical protein